VTRQAEVLFSAYRAADYADPKGFAVQLCSILSEFSEEVVLYITSPRTGIQRRSKWPPTISEVLQACEEQRDYLAKLREARKVVPLLPRRPTLGVPGSLANVFLSDTWDRYARVLEWTKAADPRHYRAGKSSDGRNGMWVALNAYQDGFPLEAERKSEAAE